MGGLVHATPAQLMVMMLSRPLLSRVLKSNTGRGKNQGWGDVFFFKMVVFIIESSRRSVRAQVATVFPSRGESRTSGHHPTGALSVQAALSRVAPRRASTYERRTMARASSHAPEGIRTLTPTPVS